MTTRGKMLAYHNDETLKQSVLTEMRGHREAERLVQGHGYWKDGKGCAVGCLLKSGNHSEYESRFGIPVSLAYLEDRIFEGLPVDQARVWPERFLDAIKVGSDLSSVVDNLMYWLMTDEEGIKKHVRPDGLQAINTIADLYKRKLSGDCPSYDEWIKARCAALDASAAVGAATVAVRAATYASSYYYSYAAAAAASAAVGAATVAVRAATYASSYYYSYAAAAAASAAVGVAADVAAYAAYATAAKNAFYVRIADKLLEIIKNCGETK